MRWLFACRKVYNYCLAERKDWIKSRKSPVDQCSLVNEYIIPADTKYPDYYYQKRQLTEAKKTNPELKEVPSQVLQEVVGKVDKAFRSFHNRGYGFPRFRKRIRSMVFPQFKTNPIIGNQIKLPKIGDIKINLHRPIPEGFVVKQVQVVNKASVGMLFVPSSLRGIFPIQSQIYLILVWVSIWVSLALLLHPEMKLLIDLSF
ncbi:RNA-guided endonuclease InsQ/TnpB family protein [Cyanobacterium aponinum]|uniref:RNA-guided endonuclease InsQ/TnpB family protein n=1 Tax=Cyanobacterium aponinum TaxID=379064 RepID=UPI001F4D53B2|nr:helix-turn-helix domain-containing protein [Cyanobacterium aponinum]